MKITRMFIIVLTFVFFITPAVSQDKGGWGSSSPLGFKFGTSKDQALETIQAHGKNIIDNKVDSKKIRTISFGGAMVELPAYADAENVETRLEFFDNKLMSSLLILRPDTESNLGELETEVTEFMTYLYGEPEGKEKILYFNTMTWRKPEIKLVVSTSQKNDLVKIQYTYEPVSQAMRDKELEKLMKGEPPDPAKEMFLDATYTRPTRYKE